MNIKNLPGGGAGFSSSKFSSKFAGASKYGTLRDSRESVLKVVKSSVGAIRSGRFDSQSAFKKVEKMVDGKMSWEQKRDVKRVLDRLKDSASEKKSSASALSHQRETSTAEVDPVRRAEILRRTRAYDEAKRLGSGETAKKIQTSALSKLKEVDAEAAKAAVSENQANTGLAGGQPSPSDNPYIRRAA